MIISLTQARITEIPAGDVFYRIQLTKPRKNSVRKNRLLLAPAGLQSGRFCLKNSITAYIADSPETALYEAVFRRDEKASIPLESLRPKSLATFAIKKSLRLVDLRGLEEKYPVLQSQRIQFTQAFAEECFAAGYDGILYASAQHPYHECICLFEAGIKKMKLVEALPLVKPGADTLIKSVIDAAYYSGLSIT